MKSVSLITALFFILLTSACSRKEQALAKDSEKNPQPAPQSDDRIVIPSDSPKLKQIKIQTIELAQVPNDVVDAPGKVELNPNRVTRVSLPVAGRISSLSVRLGDSVQQGQVLFTVESSDADTALATHLQIQGQIHQAKANILKSQSDLDRAKDLYAHNALAQKDVLTAENAHAQNIAVLEQAEANMKGADRRLQILGLNAGEFGQKVAVKSPLSGKVMELVATQGEFRNDTNAPVITIADLSTVWVSSDVPETAIRFIQVGERFDIELAAFPNEVFHARVTRIADTVDPLTRTIKVRAEMDNSRGRFRPEMFGKIRHVDSVSNVPVAPGSAIVQGDGQTSVYLEIGPGTYQKTAVKLGNRILDRVAIASGLKVGDRVVTDGVMLLKN